MSPRRLRVPRGTLTAGQKSAEGVLALLWQIYSRRCSLEIHFRHCGHRCGGGRAMSSRMAWRTTDKVGWGQAHQQLKEELGLDH